MKKEKLTYDMKEYHKKYSEGNKEEIKKKKQKYYQDNKEKINLKQKEYSRKNRTKLNEKKREYIKNNKERVDGNRKIYKIKNKEKLKEQNKKYREKNKEKIKQRMSLYEKQKRKNNLFFKIRKNISCSIYTALKKRNSNKNNQSFLKFLSYTIAELKSHIESLFEPWMNWNNHGNYNPETHDENPTWQLDHIIPHSTFNYDSMEHPDFKKCWALENLRPLDARQNQLDGVNKIRHK